MSQEFLKIHGFITLRLVYTMKIQHYVVFDGHTSGDIKAYAFKTTDLGKTWTNIIPNDDVTGFVRNIQEDYVNKDLLFLGTELGLYITINGGDKWSKFTKKCTTCCSTLY